MKYIFLVIALSAFFNLSYAQVNEGNPIGSFETIRAEIETQKGIQKAQEARQKADQKSAEIKAMRDRINSMRPKQ